MFLVDYSTFFLLTLIVPKLNLMHNSYFPFNAIKI